jgi:hypothetical protein
MQHRGRGQALGRQRNGEQPDHEHTDRVTHGAASIGNSMATLAQGNSPGGLAWRSAAFALMNVNVLLSRRCHAASTVQTLNVPSRIGVSMSKEHAAVT